MIVRNCKVPKLTVFSFTMPHNERWERRRKYLLPNFVVNPELSPVPEEERSSSSSDSGSLPDLIIEAAPNRHDDPPAFYEGLEHRMLKYYRKLLLGAKSDDDDSFDFVVTRSMCSSFILDNYTRKDTEANVVVQYQKQIKVMTMSYLTRACATYGDSKSSSIKDEENPILSRKIYGKSSNVSEACDADKLENESSDSTEIYAIEEPNTGPHDTPTRPTKHC